MVGGSALRGLYLISLDMEGCCSFDAGSGRWELDRKAGAVVISGFVDNFISLQMKARES